MRKNILIFGHSYGPQFIDINNQYTTLFDPHRFRVTVIYLSGKADESISDRHLAEEVIFLNSENKRGLKIKLIQQLLAMTRAKHFEIVICHRYKPTYIMLWVNLFYKIPALFFVMHELDTLQSFGRKCLVQLLARDSMLFAGVSNAVRDNIRKNIRGVPSERVITLYNMIDVERTEPKLLTRRAARLALKLPSEAFLIGNSGRLVKNKDQRSLIEAFAIAKKHSLVEAKLVIMGSGQLETELKELVVQLNLTEDVVFLGFVVDSFCYMKAFDVYVSSSTQEAFGRVLLEAMLAKIPVIATAVNGVPEVVGSAGQLVAAKSPAELATALTEHYQKSNEARDALGLLGYCRAVDDFSQKKFQQFFWQLPLLQQFSPEKTL